MLVLAHVDPEIERAVNAACTVSSQAGAAVSPCEFPDGPFEEAAELTILMEAASSFESLIHSDDCQHLVDPLGKINGYASEQVSATDFLHVQRVRLLLQQLADTMFDRFDVLISATEPTAAEPFAAKDPDAPTRTRHPHRRELDRRAPDGVRSLCGLPAISVPCGLNRARLPLGMQMIGRALEDATVLRAARLFQQHTTWHQQHPAL